MEHWWDSVPPQALLRVEKRDRSVSDTKTTPTNVLLLLPRPRSTSRQEAESKTELGALRINMHDSQVTTLNSQLVPDYPLCGFASSSTLLLLSHWVGGLEF